MSAIVHFLDGPPEIVAASLTLQRTPEYLRVVVAPDGKVDALDQLDDTPREGETIYAYRRLGTAPSGEAFVCGRGQGASGCYQIVGYGHTEEIHPTALAATDRWQSAVKSALKARELTGK